MKSKSKSFINKTIKPSDLKARLLYTADLDQFSTKKDSERTVLYGSIDPKRLLQDLDSSYVEYTIKGKPKIIRGRYVYNDDEIPQENKTSTATCDNKKGQKGPSIMNISENKTSSKSSKADTNFESQLIDKRKNNISIENRLHNIYRISRIKSGKNKALFNTVYFDGNESLNIARVQQYKDIEPCYWDKIWLEFNKNDPENIKNSKRDVKNTEIVGIPISQIEEFVRAYPLFDIGNINK